MMVVVAGYTFPNRLQLAMLDSTQGGRASGRQQTEDQVSSLVVVM